MTSSLYHVSVCMWVHAMIVCVTCERDESVIPFVRTLLCNAQASWVLTLELAPAPNNSATKNEKLYDIRLTWG